MKLACTCLLGALLWAWCLPVVGQSQPFAVNLFAGKKVGIYLSKKHLVFTDDYFKLLANFIQRNDTLGLSEEDIRLGATVKLGVFLVNMLQKDMHADSVYFINADPVLAPLFVKGYVEGGNLSFRFFQRELPPSTDLIFTLDGLELTGEKVSDVYAVSNRMIVERRFVHSATLAAHLYDAPSGNLIRAHTLHYGEGQTPNSTIYSKAGIAQGPMAVLLSHLFNAYFYALMN